MKKSVKLSKSKMYSLYKVLCSFKDKGNLDSRFSYAVALTKNLIETEAKAIEEVREPKGRMKEFFDRRNELIKQHGNKDNTGNLKIEMGIIRFTDENKTKFEIAFNELRGEYKEDIDIFDNENKKLDTLFLEEIEINVYQIPLIYFPNQIDTETMEILLPLVEE